MNNDEIKQMMLYKGFHPILKKHTPIIISNIIMAFLLIFVVIHVLSFENI